MAIDLTRDRARANRAARGSIKDSEDLFRTLVETVDGIDALSGVAATAIEVDRVADLSTRLVSLTAATLSLTAEAHDGRTVTVNKADGTTVTLPAASGSGARFRLIVGTTITSNAFIVQVTGNDVMTGVAQVAADGGDTMVAFETAADSDTITMNGTTTGGIRGTIVELEDIAADTWWVRVVGSATGVEATPFSAAVT